MNKKQACEVKVGTKIRSIVLGIEHEYPVSEIVLTGPRFPYFRINGILVTYHDITLAQHRMK